MREISPPEATFSSGARLFAAVGRDQEFHRVGAVGRPGGRLDGDAKYGALHGELGQFGFHALLQPARGGGAGPASARRTASRYSAARRLRALRSSSMRTPALSTWRSGRGSGRGRPGCRGWSRRTCASAGRWKPGAFRSLPGAPGRHPGGRGSRASRRRLPGGSARPNEGARAKAQATGRCGTARPACGRPCGSAPGPIRGGRKRRRRRSGRPLRAAARFAARGAGFRARHPRPAPARRLRFPCAERSTDPADAAFPARSAPVPPALRRPVRHWPKVVSSWANRSPWPAKASSMARCVSGENRSC